MGKQNGTSKTSRKNGYFRDEESKKFKEGPLLYLEPDRHNAINNLGMPISLNVAQKMIHNYWIEKNVLNDETKVFACTFGKESILSIMSQKGCAGIRFYFGFKIKDDYPDGVMPDGVEEGESLIAIGVDFNDKDIGAQKKYIVSDFNQNTQIKFDAPESLESGFYNEMVPPLTLKKIRNEPKRLIDDSLEGIIRKFFNIK